MGDWYGKIFRKFKWRSKAIFKNIVTRISRMVIEDEDKLCMQFIADIVKSMNIKGYITIDDLYNLSEKEVMQLIKTCDDSYIKKMYLIKIFTVPL